MTSSRDPFTKFNQGRPLIHTKSGRLGTGTSLAEDATELVFGIKFHNGEEGIRRPQSCRGGEAALSMYQSHYIFTWFDADEDGYLCFEEFSELVQFANDGQILKFDEYKCTCNSTQSYQNLILSKKLCKRPMIRARVNSRK